MCLFGGGVSRVPFFPAFQVFPGEPPDDSSEDVLFTVGGVSYGHPPLKVLAWEGGGVTGEFESHASLGAAGRACVEVACNLKRPDRGLAEA